MNNNETNGIPINTWCTIENRHNPKLSWLLNDMGDIKRSPNLLGLPEFGIASAQPLLWRLVPSGKEGWFHIENRFRAHNKNWLINLFGQVVGGFITDDNGLWKLVNSGENGWFNLESKFQHNQQSLWLCSIPYSNEVRCSAFNNYIIRNTFEWRFNPVAESSDKEQEELSKMEIKPNSEEHESAVEKTVSDVVEGATSIGDIFNDVGGAIADLKDVYEDSEKVKKIANAIKKLQVLSTAISAIPVVLTFVDILLETESDTELILKAVEGLDKKVNELPEKIQSLFKGIILEKERQEISEQLIGLMADVKSKKRHIISLTKAINHKYRLNHINEDDTITKERLVSFIKEQNEIEKIIKSANPEYDKCNVDQLKSIIYDVMPDLLSYLYEKIDQERRHIRAIDVVNDIQPKVENMVDLCTPFLDDTKSWFQKIEAATYCDIKQIFLVGLAVSECIRNYMMINIWVDIENGSTPRVAKSEANEVYRDLLSKFNNHLLESQNRCLEQPSATIIKQALDHLIYMKSANAQDLVNWLKMKYPQSEWLAIIYDNKIEGDESHSFSSNYLVWDKHPTTGPVALLQQQVIIVAKPAGPYTELQGIPPIKMELESYAGTSEGIHSIPFYKISKYASEIRAGKPGESGGGYIVTDKLKSITGFISSNSKNDVFVWVGNSKKLKIFSYACSYPERMDAHTLKEGNFPTSIIRFQ